MKRYEVTSTTFGDHDLDTLLNDGWEPFSVTHPNPQTYREIWLRRITSEWVSLDE
jgi:hypothetical protein